MNLQLTDPLDRFRIDVPIKELLEPSLERMSRQSQYTKTKAKGGSQAAAIDAWFKEASDCIAALAHPQAVFTALRPQVSGATVSINERLTLEDSRLADELNGGARLSAYALTLNYSQEQAFAWLNADYMAHHIQTDLGREVLFALGRHAHRASQALVPENTMRRISVQTMEVCGARALWDAVKVQRLLECFGDQNPGINVTDTGCFQPLNALLGLVVTKQS